VETTKMVRVRLLGGFRVSVGSRTIEEGAWRLRKAASLVKLLTLAPGHRLHREQVMDHLWPDLGRKAASNNLRKTLHAARKILDPNAGSRYLASRDDSLALCPTLQLWVDAEAFEEAAATARRSRDPAAYLFAVELYAGDLLPEDRYEEWAEGKREELRRIHLALLLELAAAYEEHGENELAVGALRSAIAREPTEEEAHVGLMRLYALSDRRMEALTQYERLDEVLATRLGTEPGATARRLHEQIATGKHPTSPSVPTHPPRDELTYAAKHNLPATRTSFVGREREMLEVKRALAMTRLLTLTGAGGCGKTRLAVEVARGLTGVYRDGVWLVRLAPLSDGALVPQTVARALSVPERPGQAHTDTLVDVLRTKGALLILDNCEHLAGTVAGLVDSLLDSCPHLRIMATSRGALGVEGETVWRVPALSVPDDARPSAFPEVASHGAVRLFAERARQRDPSFTLTSDNAGAVADACHQLGGLPLAIELATARMGALSVEQVSDRLQDPLGLLTSGGRTAAPRHQTMRATLDWSYGLLCKTEKRLLGRLSVFAGGFGLEAAEAVAHGEGVSGYQALEALSGLVDKSLVETDTPFKRGAPRYGMLEPVRQYAREQLDGSGHAREVHARHARYYLTLAERAEPELTGPDQADWMERLELEHDDLRAALAWSLHGGETETSLRLAGALWRFWFTRGYLNEGQGLLEGALKREARSSAALAKVLNGAGAMAWLRGDVGRAKGYFEQSLAVSAELGDKASVSRAMTNVAVAEVNLGDYARATELLERCLEIDRELGDERGVAYVLGELGVMAYFRGDHDQAEDYLEQSLALHLRLEDKRSIALTLENLGGLALDKRQPRRAAGFLEQSLDVLREIRDDWLTMVVFLQAGRLLTQLDRPARGSRFLAAADKIRREHEFELEPHASEDYDQSVRRARSRMHERAFHAAWAEGQKMTLDEASERPLLSGPAPVPAALPGLQADALTVREEEVASLAARGMTNRQIANRLSISVHTAATHVARILRKLGLRSRAELGTWLAERERPTS
jgi:predicted ATPase/DNA-binding SARP family transcriptional activator/DNA-binding CsgD family transcriptional regulator